MRVAITGASGLIGSALADHLTHMTDVSHQVIRFVRDPAQRGELARYWNPATGDMDDDALDGVDAVVNLAGAGIGDRRWTEARKQVLWDSRVASTKLLVEAMNASSQPPEVLVSASAVGFYGDRDDTVLDEQTNAGTGFLAELSAAWEDAATAASAGGTRVVLARTGLVVAPGAPFLTRMLPLFKLGLGGPMGNGRQWWPWIHLHDEVHALAFLLESQVQGPVNVCAPEPVTNKEFSRTLARLLRRPSALPVPRFGPSLLFGSELVEALLFASTRAQPAVLTEAGFKFSYPQLHPALSDVLGRG